VVGVIIGLRVLNNTLDRVFDELTTHNSVVGVVKTFGRFNIIAFASFIDIDEMSRYMLNTLTKADGLISSETFLILHHKDEHDGLKGDIDEIDRSIIGVLGQDGRRGATAISSHLGLNVATTQRRLKRLTDEGWIRVVAIVDQKRVDWYWPAMVGISVRRPHLRNVLDQVSKHPNIGPVFCTFGVYDIIADIHGTDSIDRLYKTIENDLTKIEGIDGLDLFVISESKSGRKWWL
jgi:DNA-binding Lrp family transcriptional regulator